MKKLLYRLPGFRRLDEFTDTNKGKWFVAVLVIIACILWSFALAK